MKKRPSTPVVGALICAAMALAAGTLPAAAQQAARPQAETPNYCLEVKNTAARDMCSAARTQYYSGNYRVAQVTMKKAQEASPKEGIIHAMMARIMMRFGDRSGAERELRLARKNGAPDHAVLPLLFRVMVERREEINLLNEFPEPAPGAKGMTASDILQGRAQALFSLKRVDEAGAAMDRSLSLGRDPDGLLLRAKIATQQRNTGLATKLIDEAYRLNPKDGGVMLARLAQLEQTHDDAGMLAMADQMLKLYPFSSDARVGRIKVYLKRNQDAKAKAEIDAMLVRASVPVAIYYKAVLLARAHDKKGAAQTVQMLPPEFVKSYPEYAVQMAQIASDNGSVESSAAILGAALSVAPDLIDARLKLASLRLSQNSPQSALLVLSPAQDSKDPRVQKLLGEVRARIAKDRAF